MTRRKSLYEEIVDFQCFKKYVGIPLIALGVAGLLLPLLPGLILIFLGFMLVVPRKAEEIIDKIRRLWK